MQTKLEEPMKCIPRSINVCIQVIRFKRNARGNKSNYMRIQRNTSVDKIKLRMQTKQEQPMQCIPRSKNIWRRRVNKSNYTRIQCIHYSFFKCVQPTDNSHRNK
jgi:hypothetical protein